VIITAITEAEKLHCLDHLQVDDKALHNTVSHREHAAWSEKSSSTMASGRSRTRSHDPFPSPMTYQTQGLRSL